MPTLAQKMLGRPDAMVRASLALALPVSATANTDFILNLPAGARDVKFRTKTTTAYGAATDAVIKIGSAAGGEQYVAAVSIKAAAEVAHTLVGAGMADLDTVPGQKGQVTPYYVRVTQSGTASATGSATLFAEFSLPV